MSQPKTTKVKKPSPNPDIYTALLALSLLALIIGCIILFLEFGFQKANPSAGASRERLSNMNLSQVACVEAACEINPIF